MVTHTVRCIVVVVSSGSSSTSSSSTSSNSDDDGSFHKVILQDHFFQTVWMRPAVRLKNHYLQGKNCMEHVILSMRHARVAHLNRSAQTSGSYQQSRG